MFCGFLILDQRFLSTEPPNSRNTIKIKIIFSSNYEQNLNQACAIFTELWAGLESWKTSFHKKFNSPTMIIKNLNIRSSTILFSAAGGIYHVGRPNVKAKGAMFYVQNNSLIS